MKRFMVLSTSKFDMRVVVHEGFLIFMEGHSICFPEVIFRCSSLCIGITLYCQGIWFVARVKMVQCLYIEEQVVVDDNDIDTFL